jgi:hypothetical protein
MQQGNDNQNLPACRAIQPTVFPCTWARAAGRRYNRGNKHDVDV